MKHKMIRATIFYAIIFICLWLMGCKAKEPKTITKIIEIETSDYARVKSELVINKAINDSLRIHIGFIRTAKPECDTVCNEAIARALENVNNKKSSGSNKFGLYYDKYTQSLVAYATLDATYSHFKDSVSKVKQRKSESEKIEIPVYIEKELTWEQKFNLWSGRLFWVAILIYIIYRIRRKLTIWHNLKKLS